MSYSSVYFDRYHSNIHLWEYEEGEKVHKVLPAPMFFYMETPDDDKDESPYTTIFGKPAKKVEFDKWYKYKQAVEKYTEWDRKIYESDVPVETKFIIDNYQAEELVSPDFDIHYMDIEVHSEKGFPRPEDANFPVTVITTWSTKHNKFFIFAERDFDEDFLKESGEDYEKIIFDSERDLLEYYFEWIPNEHPDIVTGWNSNGYDIPYLMNRAVKLFDEEFINKISPVGYVKERMVRINEYREEGRWTIGAINLIDMLEVYQNYTFSQQESWKLDYIAEMELGDKKIEYDGTLVDLYNNDWQKYIEYNVQDVRLLRKLEEKKKFLPLLVTFCYGCRVPFEQYMKTTRVLDGAFISSLLAEGIVLPDVNRDAELGDFIGGYVKEPIKGLHDWVVSFDATSLYPSIMMNLNISPETKIGKIDKDNVQQIMGVLSGKSNDTRINFHGDYFTANEFGEFLKENNFSMAANGCIFRQDKLGIVPRFVELWFNQRKVYKKKMLAAQAQGNKKDAETYHNLQLNFKILINSVYGYLGTKYSRFFDNDNAVAVTMTGRCITMSSAKAINHHFGTKKWDECNNWDSVDIELDDGTKHTLFNNSLVIINENGKEKKITVDKLKESDDFVKVCSI